MKKLRAKGHTEKLKKIASERINALFREAAKIFSYDPKLSDRYVGLARRISMRYKVKIPSVHKRKFCKHCYGFMMPGANCRVRTKKGKLIYYCLRCKKFSRFVYK
ncbi:ribonuclease P [Candidatus Woesearchaeota archaeon]|nr:ribonuclease P [Candidatus Woesearchaeota archaeon]